MGVAELKAMWSGGGPWHETLDEWAESREAALPRLREIVGRLLSGESSASEFRREMDTFGKQTKYGGFHGTSGQMFLNTLVNAGAENELSAALRAALPPPREADDCRRKFAEFLAFVEEARERARANEVAIPALGFAPYFLSFFWEAADRESWPIYYPNSRGTLAAHGLFADTGPLAERYLAYREEIFRLRNELETDTWGVEALLWYLKQDESKRAVAPGDGGTPQPDDLYESYRSQGLIFPDEVVTSLVLSLTTKPFVLLSGISGTGKTQIAVGLAEYLDRRTGGTAVEITAPVDDDENIYIRLTEPRLRRGRTSVTRAHQAAFALHGLPERGSALDYEIALPDGTTAVMRLNNIGFSDPRHELYLLSFRGPIKQWLQQHATPGDYLHLGFDDDGKIAHFEVVRPERHESEVPVRRHEVIAVRSDWTDPRGLIGYENPLTGTYTRTELISLLLRAQEDPEHPYVVILDEMNLARVEYYFSDFLSAMELRDGTIALRERTVSDVVDEEEGETDLEVPARLALPRNLLLIGTVNIDETTHAFSPKVLDRANVIVFNEVDVQRFLEPGGEAAASTFRLADAELDPGGLADREATAAAALTRGKECVAFAEPLVAAHELLKRHNLHFGYRVLHEMTTFAGVALERVGGDEEDVARTAFDLQLVQKVMPKLNGGRELEVPLAEFLAFCLDGAPRKNVDATSVLNEAHRRVAGESITTSPDEESLPAADADPDVNAGTDGNDNTQPPVPSAPVVYPRAAQELVRMLTRLRASGFVAFLE